MKKTKSENEKKSRKMKKKNGSKWKKKPENEKEKVLIGGRKKECIKERFILSPLV